MHNNTEIGDSQKRVAEHQQMAAIYHDESEYERRNISDLNKDIAKMIELKNR